MTLNICSLRIHAVPGLWPRALVTNRARVPDTATEPPPRFELLQNALDAGARNVRITTCG